MTIKAAKYATMNGYQNEARSTAIYNGQGETEGLNYTVLGLCAEAGELANKVKKINRDHRKVGDPEFHQALLNELGDCLWYISNIAAELNCSLANVAGQNLIRLALRKETGTLHGDGDTREKDCNPKKKVIASGTSGCGDDVKPKQPKVDDITEVLLDDIH